MNNSQNLLSTIVASPVIYVIRNAWELKIQRCTFSKYKHVETEHIWNATTVIFGHINELYLIHPDIIQIQKLTSSQIKIFLDKGLKKTTLVRKLCLKGLHETYKTFQCYLVKGKYHTRVEKSSNLAMMIQVNREPREDPFPSNQYKLCGSQQEKDAYTIS
jgi:hypothetical protein